jgi:hypothetical protein
VILACTIGWSILERSAHLETPMQTNRAASWFTAIVLCSCCLVLANATNADDKAGAKDKIRELQKQRLEVAKKASEIMVAQLKAGLMPAGMNTFLLRFVEVSNLLVQARLDLAETRAERIKAIEDAIKEFEPIVTPFEQMVKKEVGNAHANFYLAQAHLLELKIALEKAKQE